MLSYRHAFHAGNYADVVKHLTISLILESLSKKDNAFCYLDSHAGTAIYNLDSEFARKTGEFKEGIELLWKLQEKELPTAIKPYMDAIRAVNQGEKLNSYLGSPAIAQYFARPQDSLSLMELHPKDYQLLRTQYKKQRRINVYNRDGFEVLKALIPPPQKRGLVLIDPAYELKSDYTKVVETVKIIHKRWATGIYALWYPILKQRSFQDTLYRKMQKSGIKNILQIELTRYSSNTPRGMYGTGMLVINPPYQLEQTLKELLPWLWQLLSPKAEGGWRVEWLVPE